MKLPHLSNQLIVRKFIQSSDLLSLLLNWWCGVGKLSDSENASLQTLIYSIGRYCLHLFATAACDTKLESLSRVLFTCDNAHQVILIFSIGNLSLSRTVGYKFCILRAKISYSRKLLLVDWYGKPEMGEFSNTFPESAMANPFTGLLLLTPVWNTHISQATSGSIPTYMQPNNNLVDAACADSRAFAAGVLIINGSPYVCWYKRLEGAYKVEAEAVPWRFPKSRNFSHNLSRSSQLIVYQSYLNKSYTPTWGPFIYVCQKIASVKQYFVQKIPRNLNKRPHRLVNDPILLWDAGSRSSCPRWKTPHLHPSLVTDPSLIRVEGGKNLL